MVQSRWSSALLVAFLAASAAAACARSESTSPQPFRVAADVRQVMQAITIPASNAVWAAAGGTVESDSQWVAVENQAIALAESGNLLLMEGRAKDRGEWQTQALALIEASLAAARAAREHNADRLMAAGDQIYEACESCHQRYMPRP